MLTLLVHRNVDINKFSGGLRTEITELVNLTMLGLSELDIVRSGNCYSSFAIDLQMKFYISAFNSISGNLPSEIGRMSSLQHILLGKSASHGGTETVGEI